MELIICQSCGMPLDAEEHIGTNADGSKNNEYCIYCFKDGKFLDDIENLSEYIEESKKHAADYAEMAGVTEAQMIEHIEKVLPTLKRWKKD
ncbi:MAG: zinc ribbon domain-containing protein [Candidatus Peribacteria bacterium]|jgi:hypothetical protein|nr:zinc ribbon domain-containing protein [Candidatus Peribacteria bacterium]